jgi:hypothetical protein
MDSPQKFKLIDGIFSPEQAQRVIGVMVKGKIDFHNLERHSDSERSVVGVEKSEARLEYLKDLDRKLKLLAEEAKAAGKKLRVVGDIEITFLD